jgi:hypothetical protein
VKRPPETRELPADDALLQSRVSQFQLTVLESADVGFDSPRAIGPANALGNGQRGRSPETHENDHEG